MKTSNKILLTVIICIFIGIIIAAAIVRFNVKPDFFLNARVVLNGNQKLIGDGKMVSKSYKLPAFNAINVGGNTKVVVKFGNKSQVDLTTDSNLLSHIKIYVQNKTLYVGRDYSFAIYPSRPVNLVITTKQLQGMVAGGKNEIHVPDINSKQFILNLGGLNECYLSGKVDNLHINTGGKSKVFAGKLVANNVNIKTGGEAHVTVHANNKLNATIMGKGIIKYYGNPSQISQHIAGSGEIEHMGDK